MTQIRKALQAWNERIAKRYPRFKTAIGAGLIIVGLFALLTPLTPGSWLALIGLELIGVRTLIREEVKDKQKTGK